MTERHELLMGVPQRMRRLAGPRAGIATGPGEGASA